MNTAVSIVAGGRGPMSRMRHPSKIDVRIPLRPRSGGMTDQIETVPTENELPNAVDYSWAVEQFYEALYKFAFGLAGSESDAADLTQDTYRVLLAKGGEIREPGKVKSWLFTTLHRRFLGRRRHSVRFPETTVESAEWELPTITPDYAKAVDSSLIVAALQQLEESYRAPLTLFYLEEMSYVEMAEVLEVPIGTIMSRLSRGKEILRRRLRFPSATSVTSLHRATFTRTQNAAKRCAL